MSIYSPPAFILPTTASSSPGSISFNTATNSIQVSTVNGGSTIFSGPGVSAVNGIASNFMSTNLAFAPENDYSIEVTTIDNISSVFNMYLPDASPTTIRGVMNFGTQTIKGNKIFSNSLSATLLNSVVIDTSNTVVADNLATAGSPVVIKTAIPPIAGQTLISTTPFAATWQTASSGGIVSLNGETHATQNFATGTSGNTFNIVSTSGFFSSTHTFNIPDASATSDGLITTGTQTFGGDKTFTGITTLGGVVNSVIDDPSNTVTGDLLKTATTEVNVSISNVPVPGQYLIAASGTSASWTNPIVVTGSVFNTSNGTVNVSVGPSGQTNYGLVQDSGNTATWQQISNDRLRTPTSQNYYLVTVQDIGNISYTTGSGNASVPLTSAGIYYSYSEFDPPNMLHIINETQFSRCFINNGGGSSNVLLQVSFSTMIYSSSTIDTDATYQMELWMDGAGVAILGMINAKALFDSSNGSVGYNFSGFHEGNYNINVERSFELVFGVVGSDQQFHSFQLQNTNIRYLVLAQ